MDRATPRCPLCHDPGPSHFLCVKGQDYWRCDACGLRFLDPAQHPDRATERAQYLTHQNEVDDPRYWQFLSRLADPLMARLAPGSSGLDFGCGPGPALAAMLREAGHEMALYDPIFAPDPAPLSGRYDFVTCTETAEHFHDPAAEFARLRQLVRPGGILAIMTSFPPEDAEYATWRYRMDPTHVVFYPEATFRWLARAWGWGCDVPARNVVVMTAPGGTAP